EDLNRDPLLVSCNNGTLELTPHGAVLRKHRRDDYISLMAPVDYDPAATCPKFDAFFERVQPDPDIRTFLLTAAGYALTGLTGEQCVFFFIGPKGSNGKSTFLDVICHIIGTLSVN